ncbi:KGG domain-containing protein [Rickettsia bellii]|uniref:Stress-induced bacterial acidophilic repeat motif family protein n=1 Tax=Rickettsia bellii str. RML An4 TaxID=1359193 RepID=A0A0F3QB64_RICBE|nr:KGG domain-containing protein [Rickettsia bellii]KJV89492.1 stress-induced bacterial acidophilic repeat motif family protein [Rickettsia bellii str. RML An4]
MSNNKNNHDNKNDHDKDLHGKQGFASMDKEKVKEIASKGGQTSHKDKQNDDDE